jgi:hypothetical protein
MLGKVFFFTPLQAMHRIFNGFYSDTRAGDVLKDGILSSIGMQSALSDGRPNCLIIDEIDGVYSGAGDEVN